MLSLASTTTLNNGVRIPWFGLGVYQTPPGPETKQAVSAALQHGYRLIDSAHAYRNERSVGEAVRESGLPRDQVFVTTKLWNSDHGYERSLAACKKSTELLGLGPIDLYLIHWPVEGLRHETWRAMEALLKDGLVRAIGVSNYTVRHLTELMERSSTLPAVNQVELSPFLVQRELFTFCRQHQIQLEAYGPLTQGQRLSHPVLREVAQKHGKTTAQVLLRWGLQLQIVEIPKSAKPERIRENAQIFDFELDAADIERLGQLDEGFRTSWDPTRAP